jgi:hypothetical protein
MVEYGLALAVLATVAAGFSRFGKITLRALAAGVDRAAAMAGWTF